MRSGDQAAAALGFRVKSGWASAVLIGGTTEAPQLLDRQRIDLCDPNLPESHQPYHAAMGKLQTDEDKVQRLRKLIAHAARQSITRLIEQCRSAGLRVQRAGLVVGSTGDPSRISNPHIRAHALEGQLFRIVLHDALESQGVKCHVVVEKKAYSEATGALGQSEASLRQAVTRLGAGSKGSWRADEKVAALAAWVALG
jgi:hypothetical protein